MYVASGALVTALLLAGGWYVLAAVAFLGTLFVLWFFRDPVRTSPGGDDLVLSPADGTVLSVAPGLNDPETGPASVVSIFMSVFSVHINRCPVSGDVTAVRRHAGKFLSAFKNEAAEVNERVETVVAGPGGTVKFVQIAGLIARRIICRLREGERVVAGQRYGLIKFGSRVDLYVPSSYRVQVAAGDKVTGAVTVIARAAGGGS